MITAEDLKNCSVSEIRTIKASPEERDAFLSLLEQDGRKGAAEYAKKLRRQADRELQARALIAQKQKLEDSLRAEGYRLICGIDEVGRGPLAGPVVTAAVIMPEDSVICGIDDSKKLSAPKREALDTSIRAEALAYAYGAVSAAHIDEINILNATKKAMISAVARLKPQPDLLLIDAVELKTEIPVRAVIHGDAVSYAIGAASIIAKVKRDDYMKKLAQKYPYYGFEHNMGYGTSEHIAGIKAYGLCPEHRRSFCTKFI